MTHPFKSVPIASSEITPKQTYLSRRDFIKAAGVVAGSMVLAACAPGSAPQAEGTPVSAGDPSISAKKDELGDTVTPFQDITNYNNYYEFTTEKTQVGPVRATLRPRLGMWK